MKYAEDRNFKLRITPDMARDWLESHNTKNRPISKTRVRDYEGELSSGEWVFNGETVKFDWNGALLDGQHRLIACVNTGITFDGLVVTGLDPKVFSTIDSGKPRGNGDVLGIKGIKNPISIAAALRVLYQIENNFTNKKVTPSMCLELHADHPKMGSYYTKKCLMHGSLSTCLQYLFSRKDETAARTFFTKLDSGEGLRKDEPVHRLRNILVKNQISQSKYPREVLAALVIKAWNAERAGDWVLKRLSFNPPPRKGALRRPVEKFPVIL